MDGLSSALAILTSMITPAVLISASGTLILSTSNRLGRVVDRVRKLSDRIEDLASAREGLPLLEERRTVIVLQLERLIRRAQLLQRGLTLLYLAVCAFVATSLALGIIGETQVGSRAIPVVLGMLGASMLFFGSVLLIVETQLAVRTLDIELAFALQIGRLHATVTQPNPLAANGDQVE